MNAGVRLVTHDTDEGLNSCTFLHFCTLFGKYTHGTTALTV